jgi:pyridoxamine 5'-phosphate oxidase
MGRHEYDATPLRRRDLAADPIVQWDAWYRDALAAGCVEPNAMVVASVDERGRPDARYVLIRGVDSRGFWFFTNADSTKGRQLDSRPGGALVFGWLELHRQVRVRGVVERVEDDIIDAYFAARPRASRIASWASAQSSVLADRAELDAAVAAPERRFPDEEVPRPPTAVGYRVVPEELEFWQGRAARLHDRFRYRRAGGGWIIERLAP